MGWPHPIATIAIVNNEHKIAYFYRWAYNLVILFVYIMNPIMDAWPIHFSLIVRPYSSDTKIGKAATRDQQDKPTVFLDPSDESASFLPKGTTGLRLAISLFQGLVIDPPLCDIFNTNEHIKRIWTVKPI